MSRFLFMDSVKTDPDKLTVAKIYTELSEARKAQGYITATVK
jgi:hypothetical protein